MLGPLLSMSYKEEGGRSWRNTCREYCRELYLYVKL